MFYIVVNYLVYEDQYATKLRQKDFVGAVYLPTRWELGSLLINGRRKHA